MSPDAVLQEALAACQAANDLPSLQQVKVYYLGKKGVVTALLKSLSALPKADRPAAGQAINEVKQQILSAIERHTETLEVQALSQRLKQQTLDVTLPGRGTTRGTYHPVTLALRRIEAFFHGMGFETVDGPEIETDYYNFEALNFPANHPARAAHDTFYFPDGGLLRTHTSPVQIRAMADRQPPVRLIAPGRVYRCDSDVTHTPMFHQVEGLCIDKEISFANLKAILADFLHHFFEASLSLRFRASYFPFTEPSVEVDMTCSHCGGAGCRICSHSGWLEILGAGMIHPKVLAAMGLDSTQYQGWAFGCGIDRLAMLRYQIDDLRAFFEGDMRFLTQFAWNG